MRLSLTWDPRVLDGEPAARFLGSARDLLLGDSRPEQALGKFF
jgi:pyruvate/2-oxoglutarate dehydrogenase complex dihydrolipoamide acyltransferase (E2) component